MLCIPGFMSVRTKHNRRWMWFCFGTQGRIYARQQLVLIIVCKVYICIYIYHVIYAWYICMHIFVCILYMLVGVNYICCIQRVSLKTINAVGMLCEFVCGFGDLVSTYMR